MTAPSANAVTRPQTGEVTRAALLLNVALQMELGGKDAAIVCADADLASTASHIVKGAFSYSGQRCTGEHSV